MAAGLTGASDGPDTVEPLLLALRRRWWLIVGCVVVGVVASVALSKVQQSEYTASASILFRDTGFDQQLFGYSAFQQSNDPAGEAATNMALVALPTVASRTAARLHMSAPAVTSAVNISGVGQANIADVNVTEPDPSVAARIANAYAQQFVIFNQEADQAKVQAAQQQVQSRLAALSQSQRSGPVGRALETRANDLTELAALQTGNAELIQPAAVPTSPSSPNTKRNAMIGVLVGLLLGLGLTFMAERFDGRIRDYSEAEDAYGVKVLATVPFNRAVATAGLEPRTGAGGEAFGILRARLRHFNVGRDVHSLLITSALPGEGKTTTAVNLAIAEALAGSTKTVLVDADLRRPELERRLGLASGSGLTEVLTQKAKLNAVLRRVSVHSAGRQNGSASEFSVITAGRVPSNPVELMEGRAMVDLLTALREQFDLVILDTPPPSVFPDALPLMRMVTGVVIVARKNVTTRDSAQQLREQLTQLQARTLGVVANEMSGKSLEYQYYASTTEAPEAAPNLLGQYLMKRPSSSQSKAPRAR